MAVPNRASLIAKSFKVLKKHYQPVPPTERSVLEHMVYAACLEDSHFAAADLAFQRLMQLSIDWNEIRVTSVSELAEALTGLADPRRAAAAVRSLLQSIFESHYSFDLEPLKKQNLGKTVKELAGYDGVSPFVVGYVVQHALGGHSIPLDGGAVSTMYIVGIIDEKERDKKVAPGLERAVPKSKGVEYSALLHQLSAELVASPFAPHVRAILLEMNPEATDRLPKRVVKARKKPAAKTQAPTSKATEAKAGAKKSPHAKTPAKKTSPKKTSPKKAVADKTTKAGKQPAKASKKSTTPKKKSRSRPTRRKPK